MAIDYGIDVAAVDDLPDPEVFSSGTQNVAYAMARRWLTPTGGMADVGETEDYPSIDLRQWLGLNIDLSDPSTLADLEQRATQVQLGTDQRVTACTVKASFNAGMLSLSAQGFGPAGPFTFVLQVSQLTVRLLFPGSS